MKKFLLSLLFCCVGAFVTASAEQPPIMGNNTVRLYSDAGWMADIDCMTLQLLEPTGIQNSLTDNGVKVEVANNKIVVATDKVTEVTIVDMAGKRVWSNTINGKQTIALPAGAYLVNGTKVLVN